MFLVQHIPPRDLDDTNVLFFSKVKVMSRTLEKKFDINSHFSL